MTNQILNPNSIVNWQRKTPPTATVTDWDDVKISLNNKCVYDFNSLMYFIKDVWKVSKHIHNDIIKCKHFPHYCPIVRGIHRSPVNSPDKGQWRRALMFSLICTWTNGWDTGDLRHLHAHYDSTVMIYLYHLKLQLLPILLLTTECYH